MKKKTSLTIGLVLDDTLDRPDGVQQAVLAIGAELTRRGHDVHYIVAETTREDIPNIHSLARSLKVPFNGNSVRTPLPVPKKRIRKLFKEFNFDVLHVQMPYSPLFAARVVAEAPKQTRVFGTFHILPYNKIATFTTRLLGVYLSRNLESFAQCFAVSEPARAFMKSTFKVDGDVIPNPVDYRFFSGYRTKRKADAPLRIVFVGRFEERKGVRQLLRAYAHIKDDAELIMCGKGPLHDEIKRENTRRKLGIKLPGFVSDEDKARYLASADIAIFPSTSGESFGIVLAEAMAAGACVTVGGDNPGYASVLYPWPETLVNPDNTDEFVKTLRHFMVKKHAMKIGKQQARAVKEYDIRTVVDTLLQHYW